MTRELRYEHSQCQEGEGEQEREGDGIDGNVCRRRRRRRRCGSCRRRGLHRVELLLLLLLLLPPQLQLWTPGHLNGGTPSYQTEYEETSPQESAGLMTQGGG